MVRFLRDLPERPWKNWGRKGDGLTPAALARLLRPFDVRPEHAGTKHSRVRRYPEAAVREAIARFEVRASTLPLQSAHPAHHPERDQLSHSFDEVRGCAPSQRAQGVSGDTLPAHPGDCPTCGRDSCEGCS
jgi:hypothetical protein